MCCFSTSELQIGPQMLQDKYWLSGLFTEHTQNMHSFFFFEDSENG